MSVRACLFCTLPSDRLIGRSDLSVAIRDGYPISPGHTLVIPTRHVASFFDLTDDERRDLLKLIDVVKANLARELKPHGYNIAINDGVAAGQTVPHVHVHVIPRYEGDQPDPRGGVRWIFPDKADYWSPR